MFAYLLDFSLIFTLLLVEVITFWNFMELCPIFQNFEDKVWFKFGGTALE
jgi:hypothetical protein